MLDWEYQQERYKDLLREAEQERLVRSARQPNRQDRSHTPVKARVILAAGRAMVYAGSRLEAFGTPAGDYVDGVG